MCGDFSLFVYGEHMDEVSAHTLPLRDQGMDAEPCQSDGKSKCMKTSYAYRHFVDEIQNIWKQK